MKTKKVLKVLKVLSLLLIIPLFLFASALALVYWKQDEIAQKLIFSVNKDFLGLLEVEKVTVSPFSQFPYVSIDLQNVRFYETKDTASCLLYSVEDLYVGFDIKKVLKGQYEINSIKLSNGSILLISDEQGELNILQAKNISKSTTESDDDAINFSLELLSFRKILVDYKDVQSDREILADVKSLDAKIRYQDEHFFIDLLSDIYVDYLEKDKPTFFWNKHIEFDLELDFDQATQIVHLVPSSVKLDDALFKAEGRIDLDDDWDMKIKIGGDKPDFNIFAAFAPQEIAETLRSYKNEGRVFFEGTIEGKFSETSMPAVRIDFGCENAYFLNAGVNKRLHDLRFTGYFTNGSQRTLESSELRLLNFHARPEEGVFEGSLFVKNFRDPYIKVNLHADLDLEFVGQFFQLKDLEHLKGKILIDMDFDELIDLDLPAENLAKLKSGIDSDLRIIDLSFDIPGFPYKVDKMNIHAFMRDGAIVLDSMEIQAGGSDLFLTGSLSDFPAAVHGLDKKINVELKAQSKLLDFGKLLSFDSTLSKKFDERMEDFAIDLAFESNAWELFHFEYLPRGEFIIRDLYAKLKYFPHVLHDFHADLIIGDDYLRLIDFSGEIDSTDFHFTGKVDNYRKWFQDEPYGDSYLEFDLKSDYFRMNDLLTYKGENHLPEDYRKESIKKLWLKGHLDMHYDQGFQSLDLYLDHFQGKMDLHPLKFEKFKGRMHWEQDLLTIERFSGRMGQSDFMIDLSYYLGKGSLPSKGNFVRLNSRALDLDALMGYKGPEVEVNHEEAFNLFEIDFPNISIEANISKLNYHKYWLENFSTKLRIQEDHFVYVDKLRVNVANGGLQMSGYFNGSDPQNIYFTSNIHAQQLDIDKLMFKFDNFGQDQLINENIHGKVSGSIASTFRMHPDLTPIIETSEAHMDLLITDGSLVKFTPMLAMGDYFKDKNLNLIRFDTLQNAMDLKNGELFIPNMQINSSIGFMELSGRQGLDMSMDYFVRVPLKMVTQVGWRAMFGSKREDEIDPEQIDEIESRKSGQKVRFLHLKISGTVEDYKVSLGKEKKK